MEEVAVPLRHLTRIEARAKLDLLSCMVIACNTCIRTAGQHGTISLYMVLISLFLLGGVISVLVPVQYFSWYMLCRLNALAHSFLDPNGPITGLAFSFFILIFRCPHWCFVYPFPISFLFRFWPLSQTRRNCLW